MIKEKINNLELQRLVALKCDKMDFEDVTDEEIEKIDEISLSGKLINGKLSGIELESISLFPNLTRLRVSDFEITQDFIERINELPRLNFLEIMRCTFNEISFNNLNEGLKSIKFTGCKELAFPYPKQRAISIIGSEVDFKNIDFSEVEKVYIIESIIKNVHSLIDYPKLKSVNLDGSTLIDENGEQVKDIEVPLETVYTHLEEVLAIDSK